MSHGSAWALLGIERTGDVGAIRKAYAKRLKETDVEADPRAFISLREARDAAMAFAKSPEPEPEAGGEDWNEDRDFGADGFWDLSDAPEPEAPDAPAPALDPRALAEAEAKQARFDELQSLLFADEPPPGSAERMRALVREMLADREMTGLVHSEWMESWLAWAAAASEPRSDPVLAPIVGHFGWDEKYEAWDQSRDVIAVVQRHRALLFRDVATPSDSPYHKAWLELTRTEPKLAWDRYLVAGRVAKLLTIIRDHCPAAEDLLNPHRVALWDEHLEGTVKRGMTAAIILFGGAFLLMRFGPFAS